MSTVIFTFWGKKGDEGKIAMKMKGFVPAQVLSLVSL